MKYILTTPALLSALTHRHDRMLASHRQEIRKTVSGSHDFKDEDLDVGRVSKPATQQAAKTAYCNGGAVMYV